MEAAAVTQSGQPGAVAREIDRPTRGPEARPGLPSPRPPSAWPEASLPAGTSAGSDPIPADEGYRPPAPPSFTAPPSFAAPPTGPAYAPPPAPPLPSAPPPVADSSATLTGPAYPPTAPPYPPPPGRPTPPPPDPSYPASAQHALQAGPSAPPPPESGDTAQFGNSWMDEVGFNPQWERGPAAALPSITGVRSGNDRPRPRRPLVIGLFVLVAAVLVVPALLIVHAMHGLGGGSSAAASQPPASHKPTQSGAATAPATQKAAASALAALLAQSVTDRDAIVRAVGAVNQCTSGLPQAPQAFQNAAAGRQRLLRQLAQLPGRATLPPAMLRDLTGAWQASAAVDQDLGRWAQDEASQGCKKEDHNDASFSASNAPDVQATNDKAAFLSQWNQVAAKYSLTRYTTGQL